MEFERVENTIGVFFKNKGLLKEALTHRSYLNERPDWPHPHNERLEYLGDAVLELIVTENLFKRFVEFPEGQLTMIRAALVNYQSLAAVAADLKLDRYILVSRGEAHENGKAREVISANAVEAVIGAIYLDHGIEETRRFVGEKILIHTDEVLRTKSYKDPKSMLQEIIQEKLKVTPNYRVLDESGPAHKRLFRIGVYFEDRLIAEGVGLSKQEGEVEAAKNALLHHEQ